MFWVYFCAHLLDRSNFFGKFFGTFFLQSLFSQSSEGTPARQRLNRSWLISTGLAVPAAVFGRQPVCLASSSIGAARLADNQSRLKDERSDWGNSMRNPFEQQFR